MEPRARIGILCSEEDGSPKVLGETLARFVESVGHEAHLYYRAKAIKRLVDAQAARVPRAVWGIYRGWNARADARVFQDLAELDAVVLCGTTPNAFLRGSYDIDRLRARIRGKPVLYYSVQYLENAPSLVRRLAEGGHASLERFDWHLAVSDVTEIRGHPEPRWDRIGLYLRATGLEPVRKESFLAVVDFARRGFEAHREIQIASLEALGIPYLALEGRYPMAKIRDIYQRAAVFFLQFPESFGMPIAECLATGARILTPDAAWPMAWRTDPDPRPGAKGSLPECFVVYDGADDLRSRLIRLRDAFDPEGTPRRVFESFRRTYPAFYEGDRDALERVLRRVLAGEVAKGREVARGRRPSDASLPR